MNFYQFNFIRVRFIDEENEMEKFMCSKHNENEIKNIRNKVHMKLTLRGDTISSKSERHT